MFYSDLKLNKWQLAAVSCYISHIDADMSIKSLMLYVSWSLSVITLKTDIMNQHMN